MKKTFRSNWLLAGTAWLVLALTGCDAAQDFTSPEAGESIALETSRFQAFERSVLEQAAAAGVDMGPQTPAERPISLTDPATEWVLVEGDAGDASVEAVIGAAGGELHLGGHWLMVPSGTVDGLVRFRMTPVEDGTMHFELSATRVQAVEVDNDVGAAGFSQPVYLSFAVDRSMYNPNHLAVAWLEGDDLVIQQSFGYDGGSIVGALRHFSGYVLVAN